MMDALFSLKEKTALVTGASSGIGLHIAGVFARAGAAVALAARRMDRTEAAARELSDSGHKACAVPLDVTRRETIPAAFDAAARALGAPIDILFNHAGLLYTARFLEQDPAEVEKLLDTNLKGGFFVAQEAAKCMAAAKRGGSIINVASTSGLRAGGLMSSYGAAKAALIQLTRVMALELAYNGIRVNALCPGNFETDMHQEFRDKGLEENLRKRIPQRRFGALEDLDGPALLLASDAGRYMTGSVVVVDGGQTLSWM
jgi:NAD(P)-dependent dehydrogenase (short-subunit alcohol dehydrogenase family)